MMLRVLHAHLMEKIYALNALDKVEVLVITDNKEMSTGQKRNKLLSAARGEYIAFIDDDDWVFDSYIHDILSCIEASPGVDTIAINGIHTFDGRDEVKWFLSKDNDNINKFDENNRQVYYRKTNHLSPVKRKLAMLYGFPDKSHAEDKWYSDHLAPYLLTEAIITNPIYHYRETSTPKEYA